MAQPLDWAQEAPFLSLAIPTTILLNNDKRFRLTRFRQIQEDLPVEWCSSGGELHVRALKHVEVELVLKKAQGKLILLQRKWAHNMHSSM